MFVALRLAEKIGQSFCYYGTIWQDSALFYFISWRHVWQKVSILIKYSKIIKIAELPSKDNRVQAIDRMTCLLHTANSNYNYSQLRLSIFRLDLIVVFEQRILLCVIRTGSTCFFVCDTCSL